MDIERVASEQALRIAVLADFAGPHARAWAGWCIDRGHDVHAISFYPPSSPLEGATMHTLRARRETKAAHGGVAATPAAGGRLRGLARLAHALRYRRAGLRRVLQTIAPDVFHAHFVVEHGFYGAAAGVRPLIVTAWGSDVLVAPERDPVSRAIARWTLRRAGAVTCNSAHMAERVAALEPLAAAATHVITLGADRFDLEDGDRSVNRRPPDAGRAPVIISTRAHEPLYNIDQVIEAYGRIARGEDGARLVIAHGGSQTAALRQRAAVAGGRVEFAGHLDRPAFREALHAAEVFVSVPSSDGTSVALLQAMAAGCFPIVSDVPSAREWVDDGVNGFVVPQGRPETLAAVMARALDEDGLRARAAEMNRAIVEARGLNETQMPRLEALYTRLAGRA
jgi:glycosyltransferase involved in cell wall biosynthesis